jgi:hypothetical protein
MPLDAWLGPMAREYLGDFIPQGGGAVRFVVVDDADLVAFRDRLAKAAGDAGLAMVQLDTATTKLHMLQFVFFAVARALDWDALLQARLEKLFDNAGYQWPEPGARMSLMALASANGVAAPLLRATLQQHITRTVWQDAGLAQDFRRAISALLIARLEDDQDTLRDGVLDWLRGDRLALKAVRAAAIGARIGRHNARAMLVSLFHWLRGGDHPGMVVLLDINRLRRERREIADGLVYSPAAVMDCYEVLRQIIDDCGHYEGLFLVARADRRLINDEVPKRALSQYTALKMRVWDDVRPLGRDNPLAPLVVLTP